MPRTMPIQPLVSTPRDNAESFVSRAQHAAHELTATAAAVAVPVALAGATIVAGAATGAAAGNAFLGEAAAQSLGEWSRPIATLAGKAGGAVVGTSLTNSAMHLASSCQRRQPREDRRPDRRRSSPTPRPKFHKLDSRSNSDEERETFTDDERAGNLHALRHELSKLTHLSGGEERPDERRRPARRSTRKSSSSERAIHARQDSIEAQLQAMRVLIENQHKTMSNLLSPLSADIAARFQQSEEQLNDMKDELKRESRRVRDKIREHEAHIDCIAQQIVPGDEEYEECLDDDGTEQSGSSSQIQVRRDNFHGDVTYEELAMKISLQFPGMDMLDKINELWMTLPIVADGVVTLQTGEAPAALQPPPEAAGPVSRQLFSPATNWPPQSPLTAEPGATTYVARAPSFDVQGGVVQVQVPGPESQHSMDNSQSHTLPKPLLIDSSERERREAVRGKLVAAMKAAEEEQLQKSCERIPNFPTCSDATELDGFLTAIVSEVRTVSKDPDFMCQWIREATTTADVRTDTSFQEWFDHLGVSGRGFVRTDVLLLKHVKQATKRAAHLHTRIGTKEQEFLKRGLNFRGRQALLMVREHFRESTTDREHTDRRRIDAVRLLGDNIEGYWDKFVLTLAELEPKNIPSDSYLMDNVLTEMRKSHRFRSQITVWDQLLREDQRTFKQLEFMIVDFMKREQQLKTSQQIRSQTTLGSGGGGRQHAAPTTKKNSICGTWKSRGYCNKGDDCQWLHPGSDRGAARRTDSADSSKGSKGAGKGKSKSKNGKSKSDTGGSRVRSRSPSVTSSSGKPRSTKDPDLACKAWLKGNCKRADKDCKFVHNPECYWYKKNKSCNLGERCLFLHGGGRAHAATDADGSETGGAPAKPQPKPTAKVKAKAQAKAGKKKQAAMIEKADDTED